MSAAQRAAEVVYDATVGTDCVKCRRRAAADAAGALEDVKVRLKTQNTLLVQAAAEPHLWSPKFPLSAYQTLALDLENVRRILGLMRAGGAQHFHIEMGPAWERATERHARIALRLASRGGPRSEGVTHVFGGGGFGAAYNDREPVRVAIPAEATRVELVSILSGHGQTDGDNCAEWCDHRHQFAVNGHELPVLRPDDVVGTLRGCALRVVDGVPPGQGGNWAPGRAYWCPGLPVDAVRVDVTEHVTPGEEAELTYRGNFRGMEPRGGDIALNAYLVWYD